LSKGNRKFKAATSAANYQAGNDGSRPGTFNVPIVDASQYNKLGMDNLYT
jgi:hypothetical protein